MVSVLERLLPFVKRPAGEYPIAVGGTGTSGTEISGGYFSEEYLTDLQSIEAAEIFDKMRRSDAQVKMLLSLIKNPIKAATWAVEPASDDPADIEIADFVSHCLFKDMGYPDGSKNKTWTSFLHEALSMVDFGHSAFEIVHKVVRDHPTWGNYIGIKDLAFRSQKTIYEWNLTRHGAIKNIRQVVSGDLDADIYIPGIFLLVISNDKEGDNYEGISLLRPVYGNWFRKNHYRKIQATGLERAAMGIPYAKMHAEVQNKPEQFKAMKAVLAAFRANPRENIVTPDAFDIGQLKIDHDSQKLQQVIDGENTEMSKAFLATFMEMGINKSGGSYSLGSDLSDIFLSGIQLHADNICEALNYRIVRQLVDMKYGPQEEYPCLRAVGINDKAGKELAEIVQGLAREGLIQKSDRLAAHLHKTYRLPEMVEGEELNPEDETDPEPEPDPEKEEKDKPAEKEKQLSETIQLSDAPRKLMRRRSDELAKLFRESLQERSDAMISSIEKILRKESGATQRRKAMDVKLPAQSKSAKAIKTFLAEVAVEAKRQVLKELDMGSVSLADLTDLLKELPPETRRRLEAEIKLITEDHETGVRKAVLFVLNNELDRTDSVDQLVKEMKASRDRYVKSATIATGAKNFVSNTVNGIRNDVFQTPDVFDQIESFVFVNDDPQSDICTSLNGRVFSKEEYKTSALLPPLHHNCDSYIVPQTTGSRNNKPIDPQGLNPAGTPDEIARILKSKTL